jgi:N-succinyldiaminopimelate aminotransferase
LSIAGVNPLLHRLQPYPFERLRALVGGISPDPAKSPINVSIGEPKHPTPPCVIDALARGATTGLSNYPTTLGTSALREAIAAWLSRRHGLAALDPASEVLPVLGSREALFAFAQSVVDGSRPGATVVVPNPFYQIYEGAGLLAGAQVHCVNAVEHADFAHEWAAVPDRIWARTQLLYVCSPDNPTGRVLTLDDWKRLFALADRHGFVIASDECYSEIHFDEAHPPLGALAAAARLGRSGHSRVVAFGSLSKRSNAPGLRSGYAAGDRKLLEAFLRYRSYHGSAMSPAVAAASIAAWSDEAHVRANRVEYANKFARVTARLATALPCRIPDAGFYLWARTPCADTAFVRALYAEENVLALPGSFLAREVDGVNPGAGRIRIALVPPLADCVEAIERMVACATRNGGDKRGELAV